MEFQFLEMKLVLLTILIFTCFHGNAQSSSQVGPCAEVKSYLHFYEGIRFKPFNDASNKPNSVLCNVHDEKFYLNGFQLNKEQFNYLELSTKDLTNDSTTILTRGSAKRGYGTFQYKFGNDRSCANEIVFRMKVKLPIFLNGEEFNIESKRKEMSGIDIKTIKRKNRFFSADEIHIQSHTHPK